VWKKGDAAMTGTCQEGRKQSAKQDISKAERSEENRGVEVGRKFDKAANGKARIASGRRCGF